MPLTFRANGTGTSNLIEASWVNDYHDLLTGVMQDQPVTIANNLHLTPLGSDPSSAPSGSLASGTSLGIGTYQYRYTYQNQDGESVGSPVFTITTTSGNRVVHLTGITVGASGTTARSIYRTAVNGSAFKFCASLNDNTTTTFTDTVADGSLTYSIPITSTYGGSLIAKDVGATTNKAVLNKEGILSLVPGSATVTGNTSGTTTIWEPEVGEYHRIMVTANNFRNSGAGEQIFYLPSPFTSNFRFFAINNPPFQFRNGNGGSALISQVFISLASLGGGVSVGQSVVNTNAFGYCISPADQISFTVDGGGSGHNGMILIEGV